MKKTFLLIQKKVDLIKQTLFIFILIISFVNYSYSQPSMPNIMAFEIFDGETLITASDSIYIIRPKPDITNPNGIVYFMGERCCGIPYVITITKRTTDETMIINTVYCRGGRAVFRKGEIFLYKE